MLSFLLLLTILFNITSGMYAFANSTGMPVSHKEALDKMLATFLNDQDADGSVFKYVFGIGSAKPTAADLENLDITTLDPSSLKKIVYRAKQRYDDMQSGRRKWAYRPSPAVKYEKKIAKGHMKDLDDEYYYNEKVNTNAQNKRKDYIIIAFDIMAQSIYSTRYRLMETAKVRQKFSTSPVYQIGVMVGSIMEIKTKMAHIYATIYHLNEMTHFVWYLILYEKMLACYIDLETQVNRIFVVHNDILKGKYEELR